MYQTAIVEFPQLGYEPGLMTRPAEVPPCYAGLGCTPSTKCGACPNRACSLGALSDWTGGLNLQTAAIAGLAGLVVYTTLFGSRGKERRRKLSEARTKYKADVAQIRKDYPVL